MSNQKHSKTVGFRLGESYLKMLEEQAEIQGISSGAVARGLVIDKLTEGEELSSKLDEIENKTAQNFDKVFRVLAKMQEEQNIQGDNFAHAMEAMMSIQTMSEAEIAEKEYSPERAKAWVDKHLRNKQN